MTHELTAEQIRALQPNAQEKDKEDFVLYLSGVKCEHCGKMKRCYTMFCNECWNRLPNGIKLTITQLPVYSIACIKQFKLACEILRLRLL